MTMPLPQFTVVCAVWHRQKDKEKLLADHFACLQRLTVPVQVVYVFDGGDDLAAPDGATALRCAGPLTIYQAWAAGFAIVQTPFCLNLNLDDRLFPDALEPMAQVLSAGFDAATGDWLIRYDLDDAALPDKCLPLESTPYLDAWPPIAGSRTRLGIGDGLRANTLGPAVAYRTAALRSTGGIPTHFGDGTSIRIIGDFIVWHRFATQGKRVGRIKRIIGAYYSDPSSQAEFRKGGLSMDDEHRLFERDSAM